MQTLDTAFDGGFFLLSSVPLVLHIHDTGSVDDSYHPPRAKSRLCYPRRRQPLPADSLKALTLGRHPGDAGTATLVAAVLHANAPLSWTANTQAAVDWHYHVHPHRLRHQTDANVNVNVNATIGVFVVDLDAATHDLYGALMV
ncbi:hypothetical protein ColTof4_14435 [Colletotrichum tofieldiae]|nr:hypothetical protein ColTof3_14844 [Colletotrichum tofieldiae]GKT82012.1 hypothetical protein ColTof4_14435 [Colletotrichum tofieldiae]